MGNSLAHKLVEEKQSKFHGGLYHKTQVNLTYNSNRIEGSRLTEEQTRYIFETRTIGFKDQEAVPVDDIIIDETHKQFYYRGLNEFERLPDYLMDTCRSAQDTYEQWINYFYP